MDVQPNVLDQNYESRQALERIADKWTCLVVYALVDGPRRHGELRRTIDGISQKMLTQTLRSMEADGLVRPDGVRCRPARSRVPPDAAGGDAQGAARRHLPVGDGAPTRTAGRAARERPLGAHRLGHSASARASSGAEPLTGETAESRGGAAQDIRQRPEAEHDGDQRL